VAPGGEGSAGGEAPGGEGSAGDGQASLLTPGRRGFLAGAGAATLAFWVRGRVGGDEPPLQVATLWSGTELDAFARLVRDFAPDANVTGHGDGIDAFLRRRAATHNLPDVAVLSRPGLVREYARNGWLEPLPSFVGDRYDAWWNELVTVPGPGGGLYGAWVKMAYKSSFWYRPSLVDTSLVEGRSPQDWTWRQLSDWASAQADRAMRGEAVPPFSLGAMDAWVLTDWFENLLATVTEPEEYAALAGGRASWDQAYVREALREVGELWRTPGMFTGNADARSVEFEGAVRHLVDGEAAMVFEGDFVGAYVDFYRRDRDDSWEEPGVFGFPRHNQVRPVILGGDVAVARAGSRRGVDLVEYLTDEAVVRTWQRQPGYLTFNVHADDTQYSDRIAEYISTVIGHGGEPGDADDRRFDLSDQLPARLTGAPGQGSWSIMSEFLENLTHGDRNLEDAVGRAVDRFEGGG
jgi:hypothetical protein